MFHPMSNLRKHAYFDKATGIYRLIPNKEIRIINPEFEYISKSNSKGLRDHEYNYQKKEGVFRIAILGDSFTFGHGVELENTFAKQLENRLQNKFSQKSIEVINLGMIGYSTGDCYKFLISEGYKYSPDLVIYAFFVNDFNDNDMKSKADAESFIEEKRDGNIAKKEVLFNLRQTLRKAYAYNYIINSLKKISIIRKQFYLHGLSTPTVPFYEIEELIRFEYSEPVKQLVDLTFDYILKMDTYSRGIKAKFLIFYLPDYFSVYYKLIKIGTGESWDERYDMSKPQNLTQKFCDENHIFYFNTVPFLQGEAESQRLYYENDQHFTKQGHKVFAKIIYDKLNDLEIIY